MTHIDLTDNDWIREGRQKAERMRLRYNKLAERYGWKTIPKGKAPPLERLAQQLKDLEDCVKANILVRVTPESPQEKWDGVIRKAPPPKGE